MNAKQAVLLLLPDDELDRLLYVYHGGKLSLSWGDGQPRFGAGWKDVPHYSDAFEELTRVLAGDAFPDAIRRCPIARRGRVYDFSVFVEGVEED